MSGTKFSPNSDLRKPLSISVKTCSTIATVVAKRSSSESSDRLTLKMQLHVAVCTTYGDEAVQTVLDFTLSNLHPSPRHAPFPPSLFDHHAHAICRSSAVRTPLTFCTADALHVSLLLSAGIGMGMFSDLTSFRDPLPHKRLRISNETLKVSYSAAS